MRTPCKQCKFAIYEDNVQIDCKLGRLETWAKRTKVTTRTDDKTYYVIEDRICNGYNEWQDVTLEEANKILELNYSVIILDKPVSLNFNVDIPPKQIVIGSTKYSKQKHKFVHFLEDISKEEMEFRLANDLESEFYVVLDGTELSNDFINQCNYLFNTELHKFVMVEGANRLRLTKSIYEFGTNSEQIKKVVPELCLQV